jgi:hypothetical protein
MDLSGSGQGPMVGSCEHSNEPLGSIKVNPTFYGTQRFITVFTRACHWTLL